MTATPVLKVDFTQVFSRRLDFRMDVAHSLASRFYSINMFVELRSASGFTGYGECVPRSYVTGETPESVLPAVSDLLPHLARQSFSCPREVISALNGIGISDAGVRNPAAMCAVELALLDLAGKHWNLPAAEILGFNRKAEPLEYSLVVPLLPEAQLEKFLRYTSTFHFKHIKVKVNAEDPAGQVRKARSFLSHRAEIRVDANCSWSRAEAAGFIHALTGEGVVSVEQPLPADDLEGMAELRRPGGMLVTLDESVCNPSDVERAASMGACDMVNVRISKCGGLLGALRVIEAARGHGLAVQLGSQVGESCILSCAGAHLAAGTSFFTWLEGCFGAHLLNEDLGKKPYQFGHGGMFIPPDGPGLGVEVDTERLYGN
ncbi:MAG: enolase C-terminal domain-like protein [Candidatus Latescibacter sp.]|nr:enolase C-terminal domain-like protein [Candidatus Latescibacter sp.]